MSGMKFRDRNDGFGSVSILLHWVIAVLAAGLFAMGLWMTTLPYSHPLYTTLPNLHQSIGMTFLALVCARILWRAINPRPPIPGAARGMRVAAWAVHICLYLLPLCIVVSGYLIPTAAGRGFPFFGMFEVPAVFPAVKGMEDIAGMWHEWLSYALCAFVILHAAAALKHHFIDRDDTLRRIFFTHPSNRRTTHHDQS